MAPKRLITEGDVRALARGGELVLGDDALATPAALDLAFERGIRVVRGKAAASGCSCTPDTCAWKQVLAKDGTYVVVVKGGTPSITRLTEQGPQPLGRS